jgi:hypothetical protein
MRLLATAYPLRPLFMTSGKDFSPLSASSDCCATGI